VKPSFPYEVASLGGIRLPAGFPEYAAKNTSAVQSAGSAAQLTRIPFV
jgi:hypothetical protein